ncbi:hypothetical protein [Streptomyces pseudovenezuelae]|uniref:hypothetical protein n=1 Tax=Streptomyces pseudovenezuelae TaxID=67350 RepID=UPI002E82220F|nr:hypothetical protein [Streptomyces pseudovenezuelae]WUA87479.1 hypothetical protein OHO81_09330 [Streptomyces pseudovenezuelae]
MNLRDEGETVDAERVEDGELVPAVPAPCPLVDAHTVLMPGEDIPTSDDPRTTYTGRDLYVSEETAQAIKEAEEDGSPQRRTAMGLFETWCAEQGRVAKPCTTATYTEYGRHLMSRKLKVTTIRHYMSLIRTSMPPGKKPDNSLFLALLSQYRRRTSELCAGRKRSPLRCHTWCR